MRRKKKKRGTTFSSKQLILIALIAVVFIVGGIVLGMNWNRWFGEDGMFRPDVDPNAKTWEGDKPKDEGGASEGIKIPGYPSITLPKDTQNVEVALLNPEGNPCYFTFELVLKDNEEILYTSKQVPPGQAVTSITLSRALEAGSYPAVIRITTASLTDGSAMNGANVETELIVE